MFNFIKKGPKLSTKEIQASWDSLAEITRFAYYKGKEYSISDLRMMYQTGKIKGENNSTCNKCGQKAVFPISASGTCYFGDWERSFKFESLCLCCGCGDIKYF